MMNSVALLIAARAELMTHDDPEVVVANLCRMFDIAADDARAAVIAAQLLAEQPGRDVSLCRVDESPREVNTAPRG